MRLFSEATAAKKTVMRKTVELEDEMKVEDSMGMGLRKRLPRLRIAVHVFVEDVGGDAPVAAAMAVDELTM